MVLEIGCCPCRPDLRPSLYGHRATARPPTSDGLTPGKETPFLRRVRLGKKSAEKGYCCHNSKFRNVSNMPSADTLHAGV